MEDNKTCSLKLGINLLKDLIVSILGFVSYTVSVTTILRSESSIESGTNMNRASIDYLEPSGIAGEFDVLLKITRDQLPSTNTL